MQAKVSVMLPVANPASARVIAGLGASTIKLPTDLTVRDRRDTCGRRCSDVYVECPDNLGGFTRYQQIPELVRVAAPVYLQFGLRGTNDPYPAGSHVTATMVALARERVRRARLGPDLLQRTARGDRIWRTSRPGVAGLAVPVML